MESRWYLFFLISSFLCFPQEIQKPQFEERRIASVPEGFVFTNNTGLYQYTGPTKQLTFSPDGRSVAFVAKNTKTNKSSVFWNNKPGKEFDYAGHVTFNPQSSRIAYCAQNALKMAPYEFLMVRDANGEKADFAGKFYGENTREHDWIAPNYPRFSPDGKNLAYIVHHSHIPQPSNDSLYVSGKQFGQNYSSINPLIVMRSIAMQPYSPVWSPDGKKIVFCVRQKEGTRVEYAVMVNQEACFKGDGPTQEPVFSADGKHIAYVVVGLTSNSLFIDHKKVELPFDNVSSPVLSKNGENVWFKATDKNQTAHKILKWFVASKEKKISEDFLQIETPIISPDEKRVAFIASDNYDEKTKLGTWMVVVDQQKSATFQKIPHDPVFSPDSRQVAFVGIEKEDKKLNWYVVVGKQRSEAFEYVSRPVFSPDGKKLGFGIKQGNDFLWKVMDVGSLETGTPIENK